MYTLKAEVEPMKLRFRKPDISVASVAGDRNSVRCAPKHTEVAHAEISKLGILLNIAFFLPLALSGLTLPPLCRMAKLDMYTVTL